MDVAILWAVEQYALRWQTIATGAACLLIVGFESAWRIIVNYIAEIRFVDPHTERIGGDDDLKLTTHELFLDEFALVGHQASVVGTHTYFQFLAYLLDQSFATFSRSSIDDSGARLVLNKCQ